MIGIPDIDRAILHMLDDDSLYKAILVNKYVQSICNNLFWIQKVTNKFGLSLVEYDVDHFIVYKDTRKFSFEQMMNYSAARGYISMVKHLEQYTDILDGNEWVLRLASNKGHLNIVQYCVSLERHSPHVEYLALIEALKKNREDIAIFLLNRLNVTSMLYKYVVKNNSNLLYTMIERSQDINKDLVFIALLAIKYNNHGVLEYVININNALLEPICYYALTNRESVKYLAKGKYCKYLLENAITLNDYSAVMIVLDSKTLSFTELQLIIDEMEPSTSILLAIKNVMRTLY